jgi:hypothetical protein
MAKPKRQQGSPSQGKRRKPLQGVYARVRREFTAADLQKYTEVEEGIPAAQVLAELEAIHSKEARKRRKA